MTDNNAVNAVFTDHQGAEAAVKKLAEAGIDMKHLSVVGKGYHTDEKVVGFYNTGDRMMFWGKRGAFWGGLRAVKGSCRNGRRCGGFTHARIVSSDWVLVALNE